MSVIVTLYGGHGSGRSLPKRVHSDVVLMALVKLQQRLPSRCSSRPSEGRWIPMYSASISTWRRALSRRIDGVD